MAESARRLDQTEPSNTDLMGLVSAVLDSTKGTRAEVGALRDEVREHVVDEAAWKIDVLGQLKTINGRLDGHDGPIETVRAVSAVANLGPKVIVGLVFVAGAVTAAVTALWHLFEWAGKR